MFIGSRNITVPGDSKISIDEDERTWAAKGVGFSTSVFCQLVKNLDGVTISL